MNFQVPSLILCLATLAACGGCGAPNPPVAVSGCDSLVEYCGVIPQSVNACTDDQFWPFIAQSGIRPIDVHYSRLSDEPKAMEMLGILEQAWSVEIDSLGFTAPLDDQGSCGPDGRFDVFIWRGVDGAFVDAVAENPLTPFDDYLTYMAIDITGSTGAGLLDTTLAHEFNHAAQASDDWWEDALFFEMSATFVEALVYPQQDDYFFTLRDFQRHPEWSLFYDDSYRTWYMYGAAMYLHFLRERYFPGDPGFIARMWHMSRSDPATGRPDFFDAMRAVMLADRGISLNETVVEFMQWRWFVAQFDDGAHFLHGAAWPTPVPFLDVDPAMVPITLSLDAMTYGANYLRLVNNDTSPQSLRVVLQQGDPDIDWHLTDVDGAVVAATLTIPPQSTAVLVAIAMPVDVISSDTLTFDMHSAGLTLDVP